MPPLLTEETYKALALVRAANDEGIFPTLDEVTAFAVLQSPTRSLHGFAMSVFRNLNVVSRDELKHYLQESRLVSLSGSEVTISLFGRAIVKSYEIGNYETELGVIEITGRAADPVFYAKILTEISKLEDAILVDPYLPSSDLYSLLELGAISRILTNAGRPGSKIAGEPPEARQKSIALALGAFSNRCELRIQPVSKKELHDRVIIPAKGRGLMLGTSLGGKQLTTLTHLSDDTSLLLRDHYEALFREAQPVDPIVRAS